MAPDGKEAERNARRRSRSLRRGQLANADTASPTPQQAAIHSRRAVGARGSRASGGGWSDAGSPPGESAAAGAAPGHTPRRRILDAAALVFAEYGFSAARVDEIAHRADVNKAMLYYHVGDKATLFREVVLEVIAQIKAELAAAVTASSDPRERLAAVPMAFARVASKRPYFPQIMLREIAAGGVHLPNEMLVEMTGVMALTRQVVEHGKRQGVFRAVNPLLLHLMLVGSLLFISNATRMRKRIEDLQPLPPNTPTDLTAVARAISKIILEGIAKPKPRRTRS